MPPENMETKIKEYVKNLPQGTLPVKRFYRILVKKIVGGDYNLNYEVIIDDKKFLFRINIEQQSGLKNQAEYEFKTLKFLEGKKIAPKPYLLDTSKKFFPFDIIIEEFLEGPHLKFSEKGVKEVARLLYRLHSIPLPRRSFFIKWDSPLRFYYNFVNREYQNYKKRKTADINIINLAQKILSKSRIFLAKYENLFKPISLVHTDLPPSNFIQARNGLRLIDWEKPRIEDPSYDLTVFLSESFNLWNARLLTEKERDAFLKEYFRLARDPNLEKKIQIRQLLTNLHVLQWAATRICDVKEGVISKELGKQNLKKYKKIAKLEFVEQFL